jgi:hypothetical protein
VSELSDEEFADLHHEVLARVLPGMERTVATIRAQGGTTRDVRFITWDYATTVMPSASELPERLKHDGNPLLVTFSEKIVEELTGFGLTVLPPEREMLERRSDDSCAIVITVAGGRVAVREIVFPMIGASGGTA